jgi:truncated hemoglobin YjbI
MNLSDKHFDAVVENLAATLKDLGVADDLIQETVGVAESVRGEVLSR